MKQLSMTDYHSSDRVMRNRRESTSSGTKFIKLQNGKNLVKITNFCFVKARQSKVCVVVSDSQNIQFEFGCLKP